MAAGAVAASFAATPAMIAAAGRAAASSHRKLLTLVLVIQAGKVLLGRKKRGFGEGKLNGFGGKVEPGETVFEGAIRELEEEACIRATNAVPRGRMLFEFQGDETILDVRVFSATEFEGTPTETEEMTTEWFDVGAIPFDEMWADDRHWMPRLLAGDLFRGYFLFRGHETIVDGVLQSVHDASQIEEPVQA